MSTNIIPEKPNPVGASESQGNSKRDTILIAALTVSPVFVLLAVWLGSTLDATTWTAIFGALLVACTIAQVTIAKWQRDTMIEQMKVAQMAAEAAKDTVASMRQDQRAWLVVSKPEIVIKPKGGLNVNLAVQIKNCGNSPAFIRFQGGTMIESDILAEEMPDHFNSIMDHLRTSQPIEVVLAPGDDEHTFHMRFDDKHSLPERGKAIQPWKAVFVLSGVVYFDSGAEHYTTVCHRYIAYEDPPRFIGHRWHNHMT